jgi:catechol 2,3-dioxygenase-like lactoylglutathione lyase family enzyme
MTTAIDIAYVRYQVKDLDTMEAFLTDFGLHRSARTPEALYMRANAAGQACHITELGPDNRTLGFGLKMKSAQDLQALATRLGLPVQDNPEPGGGQRVRFTDPAGFQVDALHGQAVLPALPHREPLQMNPASGRTRLGKVIRLKSQPSSVMRLGHVAVLVQDFRACLAFYTEVLGFKLWCCVAWRMTQFLTVIKQSAAAMCGVSLTFPSCWAV